MEPREKETTTPDPMENLNTDTELKEKTETVMEAENGMTGKSDADKPAATDSRKGKKPARGARKWISALLIACGLLLILVPFIITQVNTRRSDDIIDQFLREAQQAMADSESIMDEDIVLPVSDEVPEPADTALPEPTAEPDPGTASGDTPAPAPTKKPLMSKEEIQRRMTGVLIIDKIDLRMIIMDGVDEETLRVAAGRMTETGNFDEIGNVVLAGHRSYTFGKYFNRLDELEPGDKIVVQTKTKTLEYEIYKKHIIEPDDLSILKQSDSEKILTLFTCHPVVVASHRLVVHAKQIN